MLTPTRTFTCGIRWRRYTEDGYNRVVYLRRTRRTNRDGSIVCYLQLVHSYRDPETGVPSVKVLRSLGRVEQVDRAGLERLAASIHRFLASEDVARREDGEGRVPTEVNRSFRAPTARAG